MIGTPIFLLIFSLQTSLNMNQVIGILHFNERLWYDWWIILGNVMSAYGNHKWKYWIYIYIFWKISGKLALNVTDYNTYRVWLTYGTKKFYVLSEKNISFCSVVIIYKISDHTPNTCQQTLSILCRLQKHICCTQLQYKLQFLQKQYIVFLRISSFALNFFQNKTAKIS